jgi:ABC-type glutathione transport system ATPase component
MIAEAHEISKLYTLGSASVTALHPTSFSISSGEFLAILGPSGSGKSTLMNIIGLLDRPSTGQFWLNGTNCGGLSDDEAAQMRNRFVGFVFQAYHLLPRQTVLKNVELPLLYAGIHGSERKRRAIAALTAVKLSHRIHLGGGATARGYCAGNRYGPAANSGRRADRRAGHCDRLGHPAAADGAQPGRPHDRHGHPQRSDRAAGAPDHLHSGWKDHIRSACHAANGRECPSEGAAP